MAAPYVAATLVIRVLVSMQLLQASSSAEMLLHTRVAGRLFLGRAAPQVSLDKLNEQILLVRDTMDNLTLHCKMAKDKDEETLEILNKDLRSLSGEIAGNVAQQSGMTHDAKQGRESIEKLKERLAQVNLMCESREKHFNSSVQRLLRDQSRAGALRELSSKCHSAVLAEIKTTMPDSTITSSLTNTRRAFSKGCGANIIAPMLAAGQALVHEAKNFSTSFAKQAFQIAHRRAAVTPMVLARQSSWPSRAEPRSTQKEKSSNMCTLPKGAVNCNVFGAELETLVTRLAEQKNEAIASQRRHLDECVSKKKDIGEHITSMQTQFARSSSDIVRLNGVKARLAAARASVVQRLETTAKDAKELKSTCKSGVDAYEGELEDILRKRQALANKQAGKKILIRDCEVTDWIFSKCSKQCRKNASDDVGLMRASRSIVMAGGFEGASCPALSRQIPCNDKPCPTHCVVSEWDKWSSCSRACGGGTHTRSRSVVTQVKDGGKKCPTLEQRKSCNIGSCIAECKLSKWTPWSTCTRSCKFSSSSPAGRQHRTREVLDDPGGQGGGSNCPSAKDRARFRARACNTKICPKEISCDSAQDVVFLLDASGAAGKDFQRQVTLVSGIVGNTSKKARFGVISYGKDVKVLSRLTVKPTIPANSPRPGGIRSAAKAEIVGRSLFADPGVGGERPKIVVLLLGGAPASLVHAKKAADELRGAGVRVVVGLVDDGTAHARQQACALANKPCSANVEAVASWEQMAQEPGRFLAAICSHIVSQ